MYLSLHCLAYVSVLPADAATCDLSSDPCPMGQACVATGTQGQLQCHHATVKYVPSYSTKFECQVNRVATDHALQCQNALRCCPARSPQALCETSFCAVQDCKGDPTDFRWNVTNSADSWEQEYGWPPDSMWAESIWPAGQPAFALFQVRLTLYVNSAILAWCWASDHSCCPAT